MHATQDSTEVSIKQYIDVLRRRWLWVVLTPAILVGLSLYRDVRAEPVYSAQAELLLQANSSENIFTPSAAVADPQRALQNELRIIRSRTVKQAVAKEYGKPIGVNALAGGDDDIIIVSATAPTGREAAERVNTYITTYQDTRLDAILEDLTSAKTVIQQQIDDFQAEVDKLNEPLEQLDAEIATLSTDDPRYEALVANRARVESISTAARNEAQNQLNDYQQRLQVLQLSERLTTTGGVQILNPATAPSAPISPTTVRNAIQALLIGLMVGVALAFLRDQLDDSIRTKADFERAVKDLPMIALLPDDGTRQGRDAPLVTVSQPMSAAAEAFRGLRTTLQYAAIDHPIKTVLITSASANEGKTTTLANLAMTFAQTGVRVAVVGADLRKPRLHKYMQVDGSIGLTSVVVGDLTLADALQTSPLHANIRVLSSGPLPPNPSELLSHPRTARLLEQLAEQHDIVLIDCPPVLPVTDTLVLSKYADATLFMTFADKTTRRTSRRAIEMLQQVSSPLLGAILAGVASEDNYGSYYEYYGYTTESKVPVIGRFLPRRPEKHPTLPKQKTVEQASAEEPSPEEPVES